ncbi:MAG: PAS domain S-box protein [Betaproteobacteria bacterium]|jgi:two-component system sensor histidine kinase DctS|uniref:histidine kinase n=1 Tax=Candidatus Proximibacter danicus TaxID=2954365 RepID=A0A9D7JZZ1_9PROT|nr:PAS domain S-box protein [Candidatus Proximibacter danicus]MBK9446694.1 PAS domain S-box protein [Betaproteobacteria bacterium]
MNSAGSDIRTTGTTPAWSSWYLTMPKLAVGLLVVLLIALLWLLQDNEKEEQRATLIADVLWLEQSFRFHLEGNAEQLLQLSLDLARSTDSDKLFDTRARHLLKTSPELAQLAWLDYNGVTREALPSHISPRQGAASGSTTRERTEDSFELAKKLGKPVFSRPYAAQGEFFFELHVPVYRGDQLTGMLVATHSIGGLVGQLVPWWFVEKYQLHIIDDDSTILASKSKIDAGPVTLSHQVALDPPGYGLALKAMANRVATSTAQNLIMTLIIFLAAAVFWSLWAIRGLMRHRLAAEQALRSEHAFRKAMEDSLTVGMRARDREGRITYVNPAFCEMTGFDANELIGALPPYPYWNPDEINRTRELHNRVLDGLAPPEGFELRFRRKNGDFFDALVYEAPLIDADNQHTGWMGSVLDITERKQAEELARQQEEKLQATSRLVTMGEMASTLAHELNQPLAAISSYNTGCMNKLDSGKYTPEELRGAMEKLGVQAQRAGKIIRRVHDFVRKSEPQLADCDLAEVIDDAVGFIEHLAQKRSVRIEREIPGWRQPLLADQVMIEQVLLNLMRNAIEAMSETPPESRRLSVRVTQHDGLIEVRVIDNGSGIADSVMERLFTPFFSTKPNGMGMGLNICRSIIEYHKGRLWVENNPDGGTTFAFTLPLQLP